jgi:predicted MPP superfamily phosphohydrolase
VVGVLGNHDWYNSRGLISRYLSELGVRMVDNAHVLLDARTRKFVTDSVAPSETLCIAGVGDFLTDEVNIHRALKYVPERAPRIVLCHNPDGAELGSMQRERIDLMMCGHTHGGQITFPLVGPLYVPCRSGTKYAGGLVKGPGFPVLVSRGVGMSICPVRLGVPPEIVEITLAKA